MVPILHIVSVQQYPQPMHGKLMLDSVPLIGQPALECCNLEGKKSFTAESTWWDGHLARHSNRQAGSLSHQIIFFSAGSAISAVRCFAAYFALDGAFLC